MPALLPHIYRFLFKRRILKKDRTLRTYRQILEKSFYYYIDLPKADKEKFLERVYRFHKGKTFHLPDNETHPEMEVLLSAAAIQITFGLEEYRFGYFTDIYIMKDAYTYGFSGVPWAGHVNSRRIYISWTHFMRGYENKVDRFNVGLHEMAHAMEYEFQYGRYRDEPLLVKYYTTVKTEIKDVLEQETFKNSGLYTEQGLQNHHECWAESAECFFETPTDLKIHYPRVYEAIKILLNQDPITRYR